MRVIIADDHPLFRAALRHAVSRVWDGAEVVEASSAAEARAALGGGGSGGGAEALLLDLHMEDSNGLSVLMDLRQDFPALPIAIVSGSEEPRIYAAARQLGAAGFIPKSSSLDEMRAALAAVREGDSWFPENAGEEDEDLARMASLTPAQRRILGSVRQGLLNKQIAHEQDISEATVKAHITAIFRKLGVGNRTQAVLLAAKLDVDQPVTDSPADSATA
ncbi:response regulator transcription factor [Erythrobacter sp.]|uniref:response regulator transcription factor n=1 Tax=Erythrobacter sp. TaxID=1042 RepID=UPI001425E279|nr:response regulator transcription factor [Erythrobacter sp.]QIQ85405.1 MAG: response regulator transcription factor [Erythrobacter sp.]